MPLDHVSMADASLLRLHPPEIPLHTGGVEVFGPGLSFSAVSDVVRARLDRAPRARQRIRELPLRGGPVWLDDPDFDLSYHLRHEALPAPGDAVQLGELVARIISRPLDRRRPLWELYVIGGLIGGRTVLLRKVHLAAAGAGPDLLSILLDAAPDREAVTPGEVVEAPAAVPPPSDLSLAAEVVRERVAATVDLGRVAGRVITTPGRLVDAAGTVAGATFGAVSRLAGRSPSGPLQGRISSHRRFAHVRLDLDDLREVRRTFGGSVNDGVVAVVGDAIGRLLRWRAHETADLDLKVMVPVRVSGPPAPDEDVGVPLLGEGVVGVLAPLPVMRMDPVARLYRVMGELAGIRESRQAVAARDLITLAGYAPPTLHAMAARLASAERRYHVALSNAPGPQEPRYLAGVQLEESYPFIPLAGDAALSVAVSSYAGGMYVGILGDRDGMADLDLLPGMLADATRDLRAAADRA